jgi:hypothetical protein
MNTAAHYANGLVWILQDLKYHLRLSPSFAMYDDDVRNPNAFASEAALAVGVLGHSPDGTVAVGRTMMKVLEDESADFGSALTATCAHEFGHILQYKTVAGALRRLPQAEIRTELHADYVCGYFAAHRVQNDPNYDALTQAVTQYEAGDGKYKAVSHGTYKQRGDAVYAGFQLGYQGPQAPQVVAQKGVEYVQSLKL